MKHKSYFVGGLVQRNLAKADTTVVKIIDGQRLKAVQLILVTSVAKKKVKKNTIAGQALPK